MDKKQYEVMSLIMAKGRKFLDEIFGLMKENGLLDKKYTAHFCIGNYETVDGIGDLIKSAELVLSCDHSDYDERRASEMEQWNEDEKGWRIVNDPICKSGFLPKDIDLSDLPSGIFRSNGQESNYPATGETAKDAGRSGNGSMWFRDDGGDPPMVCGSDLKEVE